MPIFFASEIITDILAGAIIMKDAKDYSTGEFLIILFGGLLNIVAVWIIV